MSVIKMPEQINVGRRRLLGAMALSVAAAELVGTGPVKAQSTTHAQTFGALKQIDAGLLNVGYAESGPADGRPVILLQGWPYDIHSYIEVAPILATAGYRVIVPHFRGYGTTQFLSSGTFRNGQQSAVALDIIALIDALNIQKAILAGFDWGGRTSLSLFTTTAGGSGWLRASRNIDAFEARLAEGRAINVPTITLEGDANGAPHPDPSTYANNFSGKYQHRTITGGVGHNLPQEAPQAFAQAVIDVDGF